MKEFYLCVQQADRISGNKVNPNKNLKTVSNKDKLRITMNLTDNDTESISFEINNFIGCKVKDLPVGVPFQSQFFIPTERRSLFTDDVYTFIITPVKPASLQRSDEASDEMLDEASEETTGTSNIIKYEDDDSRIPLEMKLETLSGNSINDIPFDNTAESVTFPDTITEEPYTEQAEAQSRKRKKVQDHLRQYLQIKNIKHEKTVNDKLSTEEPEQSRRKSSRVKAVGYRPSYKAMEKGLDKLGNVIGDEEEESNTDIRKKFKHVKKRIDHSYEMLTVTASDLNDQLNKELEGNNNPKDRRKKERIKIKLEEHKDKYREEVVQSYARKDRGKTSEETSQNLFACTVCNKFKTGDIAVLESHIEMHVNRELNCDQCDFVAPYITEVFLHKRQKHKRFVNNCSECGKEIGNGREGMKNHLGKEHGSPQWACTHCLKKGILNVRFITNNQLKTHTRIEHPERFVQCKNCEKLFKNNSMLRNHIKNGCQGKNPPNSYPCEKCGKSFMTKVKVTKHIDRVHNKVRRYQCPHCPYASASKGNWDHHKLTHTGYHPYKCDQCSFSCIQSSQLVSHMRTHTGEKPYKCSDCSYAAAWNVQLKEHQKAHQSLTAVVCTRCDIVFKDARGLKSHDRREHP